jgi:hypothetical protein
VALCAACAPAQGLVSLRKRPWRDLCGGGWRNAEQERKHKRRTQQAWLIPKCPAASIRGGGALMSARLSLAHRTDPYIRPIGSLVLVFGTQQRQCLRTTTNCPSICEPRHVGASQRRRSSGKLSSPPDKAIPSSDMFGRERMAMISGFTASEFPLR